MKLFSFALLPVLLLASCRERSKDAETEALNAMEAAQSEFAEKLEASLENADGSGLSEEDLQKHHESVNAAADKMGGKLGEAIRAVNALDNDSGEALKKLDEYVEQFVETIDWSSLKEAGDYDVRREFLQEYKEFNEGMIADQRKRPEEVRAVLDKINYQGAERREFETGVRRKLASMAKPFETIRQCDIDICDSSTRVLNLLEKVGEDWQWDSENGQVIFENDADLESFNAEMILFDEFAVKQAEAQNALLEAIRN